MVSELDVMISLDTSKAIVMREGVLQVVTSSMMSAPCKSRRSAGRGRRGWRTGMPHAHAGQPCTMQVEPHYDDLLGR